jgi:hypothetical protein
MKDIFDQQHLPISSFVSFLNTAISKQQAASGGESSQVQHRTDGVGRAKATWDPSGVTTKALVPSFEGEKLRFK